MKTTDKEFFRIINYINKKYGISLIGKRALVEKRLDNVLTKTQCSSTDEFMDLIEKEEYELLDNILISEMLTNHTFFMRESSHFDILNQIILPKLKKCINQQEGIRIWSAATSSGQEAYTINMILQDYFGEEAKAWTMKVVGTDISQTMLDKAIAGDYTKEEMETVPDKWKSKYFIRKINGDYKINDYVKANIVFKKQNLIEPIFFDKNFHVIFLRNVLIYFDIGIVNKIVDKVADFLEEGGYLFIGLTEILDINSTKLKYIQPSVYRKL